MNPQAQSIWYCPSRWLLAHHDKQANINTFSSHMSLADLNNTGENLLALIDFKRRQVAPDAQVAKGAAYSCRLRIYRGQQLIYNHFLNDLPSSLLTTSIRTSVNISHARGLSSNEPCDQATLTMTVNDDIYFYHGLKPSHRISLKDDAQIIPSINRSEVDAWQMVKQNKVDVETLRDLLAGLADELGQNELTSHTRNFLALASPEERKNYILLWKIKRLDNEAGEHLMSMDTICCSAARLRYTSGVTQCGDFGATRESLVQPTNKPMWNRILDIQRDGLVLGTEDRHLLIYELRLSRSKLEAHHRLASVPDHLLVERRSPDTFELRSDLRKLTYKVLVSCRNRRIYILDQRYLVDTDTGQAEEAKVRELLTLKSSAVELQWSSQGTSIEKGVTYPRFVVACTDRRVYCYTSLDGQCLWLVNAEEPIKCIASIPNASCDEPNESSLLAVASRASRIDLFLSSSGRIVDSIYFGGGQFCRALKFGRFGREDNCLCVVTSAGALLILVLKRTAKFGHGQCLSSSGSFAMEVLGRRGHLERLAQWRRLGATSGQQVKLPEAPGLASSLGSGKSSGLRAAGCQSEHECDSATREQLADYLAGQRLQVPAKGREFVRHIVKQSRHSAGKFCCQMESSQWAIKPPIDWRLGGILF